MSHKCLTSYVTRLHNSTCFCALYAHTYLTLLIYIAGDFVHFTSVSDTVWWSCMPAISYNTLHSVINLMSDCFYWFKFAWDCTLHFVVITLFPKQYSSSLVLSASFPGPTHLFLQHSKLAWWGPGNKTISIMYTCEPSWAMCATSTVSLQHEEIVGAFQIIGGAHAFHCFRS